MFSLRNARTRAKTLTVGAFIVLLFAAALGGTLPSAVGTPIPLAVSPKTCFNRVGLRIPILLVHGYNAGPSAWDQSLDRFRADRRTCVEVFDYKNASTDWVNSTKISGPLASRVKALSHQSQISGGSGKVIVVAHSMGGLAIRCAASTTCRGDDQIKTMLRDVITFDTPNEGTFWKSYGVGAYLADLLGPLTSAATCYEAPFAQLVTRALGICDFFQAVGTSDAAAAFTPGSGELKRLPLLPKTVPVYGLAGSVEVRVPLFLQTVTLTSVGDYIVARDSAKSAAHKVNGLGGLPAKDIDFGSITIGIHGIAGIDYKGWHGTETTDKAFVSMATAEIKRAVDREPLTTLTCDPIVFSPNSEDAADTITATAHSCAHAGDLIRAVRQAHNFYSGPRTFAQGEYGCTVVTDTSDLAVGAYRCTSGLSAVTWMKY